ncbi:hypothetical protein [Streptomyces sp. NBC_00016]|uniref:hypothetical protein n=1 Tax=Streptomyces sp. NBC_00016 TaxID=2975622 RepID=UPI00386B4C7D
MHPGHEPIELPAADDWTLYYASRRSASSDRGALISAAAEAEGIRPTKALEVAENPTALRAAIMADPKTAEAARNALKALTAVDADPQLRASEQRVRFQKALKATRKNISSIDPTDLPDVVDDDLRQEITSLQELVNALAASIVSRG